jgi:hypothetical protein
VNTNEQGQIDVKQGGNKMPAALAFFRCLIFFPPLPAIEKAKGSSRFG